MASHKRKAPEVEDVSDIESASPSSPPPQPSQPRSRRSVVVREKLSDLRADLIRLKTQRLLRQRRTPTARTPLSDSAAVTERVSCPTPPPPPSSSPPVSPSPTANDWTEEEGDAADIPTESSQAFAVEYSSSSSTSTSTGKEVKWKKGQSHPHRALLSTSHPSDSPHPFFLSSLIPSVLRCQATSCVAPQDSWRVLSCIHPLISSYSIRSFLRCASITSPQCSIPLPFPRPSTVTPSSFAFSAVTTAATSPLFNSQEKHRSSDGGQNDSGSAVEGSH